MKATHLIFAIFAGLTLLMTGCATTQTSKSKEVVITVAIVDGKIDLTDGKGRKADYVRVRHNQRLIWEADGNSVATFDLEFSRISDGEGAVGMESDWPFIRGSAGGSGAGRVHEDKHKVEGANRFNPKIVTSGKRGVYKYTITATRTVGDPIVFDPMIILD